MSLSEVNIIDFFPFRLTRDVIDDGKYEKYILFCFIFVFVFKS